MLRLWRSSSAAAHWTRSCCKEFGLVEAAPRDSGFHRAAVGDAVKAALVVAAESPRAFGDIEDDAFADSQELIAQVGCAADLAEGNE